MCIALERVRFVAALTPKRLLMPSFVGPKGKRARLDPGTVLACVYDAQDGDGAVSKIVDVAHKTVGKCQKTFLDLYAWKVKQLFQKQNRIAIVCDGTPFNGEEFEIFLVYCADIDIFASMQPQVCMIRKGVSIGYTAPPVSAQFCTKSVPVTENRAQSRTFSHVPALPRTFSHTSAQIRTNPHKCAKLGAPAATCPHTRTSSDAVLPTPDPLSRPSLWPVSQLRAATSDSEA